MQRDINYEIKTCHNDEVPTKLQTERNIATEVPIRTEEALPECYVALQRLSEDQIYYFCHADYINEDVQCKTEELVNRTVAAVNDPQSTHNNDFKRRRNLSKLQLDAFEQFKRKRQGYIRRRKRAAQVNHFENSADFEDHSDYSPDPDMSQDEEFKCPSSQGRGRKRIRRGRKYERDSEWSPYTSKNSVQSQRTLRPHARRRFIESDTSSSEEDPDLLFQCFNELDSDAATTDVPSQSDVNNPTTSSTSSASKAAVENDPSAESGSVSHANSAFNTHTSDILSDIMRDMDQLKPNKLISPLTGSVKKTPQINIKQPAQRGRKRFKLSPVAKKGLPENVDLAVSNILKEMVNSVCKEQRQQQLKDRQLLKKCKWCQSQFPTNKSSSIYCPVCHDLGRGKLYTNKKLGKIPKSLKQNCANNKIVKKGSTTMSRVMKILPKQERQRLIYTEKNNKLLNEKGYNHCKSFSTPKDLQEFEIDVQKTNIEGHGAQTGKEYEKIGVEEKIKINQGRKKIPNESLNSAQKSVVANSSPSEKVQEVHNKVNKQGIKRCMKDPDTSVISKKYKSSSSPSTAGNVRSTIENAEHAGGPFGKHNQVSLKRCDDGLFLMTFPDSDENFDSHAQAKTSSQLSVLQSKHSLENSNKFNGSRATQMSDTNSISSNMKSFQAVSNNEQYRTYFLPPVPTVVVANYSASHENNGDYSLSGIFYQNEYTQPRINNSINPTSNSFCTVSNVPTLLPSSISHQNSISSLQHNSSVTLSAFPLSGGQRFTHPFTNNSSPVLNSLTVKGPNNSGNILPVVSSVVSLSSKASNVKEIHPSSVSNLQVVNNFVNSQQLEIKITHVSSEKTYESNSKTLKSGSVSEKGKETSVNSLQSENTHFSENKERSIEEEAEFPKSDKTASENVSLNSVQPVSMSKISVPKENPNKLGLPEHISKKSEDVSDPTKFGDNNAQKSETLQNENSLSSLKVSEQTSGTKEKTEHTLPKEPGKTSNNVENDSSEDIIKKTIDNLGAVSILAILDLEKNPQAALQARILIAKSNMSKLQNEKKASPSPDVNERIINQERSLEVLDTAKKFLSVHGTFAKVSDFFLKKEAMLRIKKEMLVEEEEDENQSSCRFSQRSQSTNSNSEGEFSRTATMPSPASVKMESFSSCSRLSEQAAAVNHIEKMQSQIAAMNTSNLPNYDASPMGSTVHHFPLDQIAALPPSVAAPTPITPRNDCMGGESRETPSRGSGPRTPARPESATSQPEEQSLMQIKKELMEASGSPPSQCAFSQNTPLSQITSQMSVMSENQSLNIGHAISNSPAPNISVHSNHSVIPNEHTSLHMQSRDIAVNRTTAYNNNPNFSNVLLNIPQRNQMSPSIVPGVNSNMEQQNRQILLSPSLYIQSGTGLPPKQAVPSISTNQYVIRSPFSTNSNGGTVVVSSSQVGGQNVGALLTNVSNQQFYTSNQQVSQIYYPPPSTQINCIQNSMPTQAVTIAQNQQAELSEQDQMFCAVCKNVATLRCKQCAKVAYCNTACAKTYWHQKHKMECKPLVS